MHFLLLVLSNSQDEVGQGAEVVVDLEQGAVVVAVAAGDSGVLGVAVADSGVEPGVVEDSEGEEVRAIVWLLFQISDHQVKVRGED